MDCREKAEKISSLIQSSYGPWTIVMNGAEHGVYDHEDRLEIYKLLKEQYPTIRYIIDKDPAASGESFGKHVLLLER